MLVTYQKLTVAFCVFWVTFSHSPSLQPTSPGEDGWTCVSSAHHTWNRLVRPTATAERTAAPSGGAGGAWHCSTSPTSKVWKTVGKPPCSSPNLMLGWGYLWHPKIRSPDELLPFQHAPCCETTGYDLIQKKNTESGILQLNSPLSFPPSKAQVACGCWWHLVPPCPWFLSMCVGACIWWHSYELPSCKSTEALRCLLCPAEIQVGQSSQPYQKQMHPLTMLRTWNKICRREVQSEGVLIWAFRVQESWWLHGKTRQQALHQFSLLFLLFWNKHALGRHRKENVCMWPSVLLLR